MALVIVSAIAAVTALPAGAAADQASQPGSPAAGRLDVGADDSCAVAADGSARCWGYGGDGEMGYGNGDNVGDDETPASVGPLDFGAGRTVTAISAGSYHTCALLSDGTVRCWGYGADGRLGYGNYSSVSSPAAVGGVDLGAGHTALAISAGGAHTCAIRDDGSVLCWGFGFDGQLGYGNAQNLGDTSTPGTHAPVNLGAGHTATAISAGGLHTCAILDDGTVRCWGFGALGQLGYGDTNNIGDSSTPTPASVGAVSLGPGRTATAISAGGAQTCAILDNASVRCWGYDGRGELGYGNTNSVGATNLPSLAGPVDLGPGRAATAISAGTDHTCAILDNGSVLCWGNGADGRLGYGSTSNVGDAQTPGSVGPVDLGPGRTAVAISAGGSHTCALLDNGSVRCWGYGAYGQLGYCSTSNVGDAQTPGSAGPVNLQPGDGGVPCASPTTTGPPALGPLAGAGPPAGARAQAARARALRACLAQVSARARRAPAGSKRRRQAVKRRERVGRRRCLRRYGRTPGPVTGLRALTRGKTKIELEFAAPGTDANHPPPARTYLVKQSLRPIRTRSDFIHAQSLCHGACRFPVTRIGGPVALSIVDLRPGTTYYYAVAARDNVSARLGPRSVTVKVRTA